MTITSKEKLKLERAIDNREALAQAKIDFLKSNGPKSRLAAQKAILKAEMEQELDNEHLIHTERELIKEQYRQRSAELDIQFYAEQVNQILGYTQQALDIVSTFMQAKDQREQAALRKEFAQNDLRRQKYKRLYEQKILTEQEYNQRIGKLQEEEDKKKAALEKKQFLRQQKMQIAMAVINGAMAVTSTLAAVPGATDILSLGAFRAINIALAVATTASQIAVIASQKPPEYAKGGLLRTGKRHSEGGMPVLDPNTGQKVAEVEQGEAILSRATVANNPELVDALLQSSMYQGGRRIRFFERPLRPINYARINAAVTRSFENGGIMAAAAPQQDLSLQNEIKQSLLLLAAATQQLTAQLQQPITATITQKKIDEAAALRNRILSDASFKP